MPDREGNKRVSLNYNRHSRKRWLLLKDYCSFFVVNPDFSEYTTKCGDSKLEQ
jgi:hypothetical protein